ncbi:major intrinsically disordered Notch2-binding receptor 1-like [Vanacampus margaritifer]
MDYAPEESSFLSRILADLHGQHAHMSEQEVCASLCARLDPAHLAELRALLFRAASMDPHFPATLFRDKMRAPGGDAQSKRRVLAADVVAMFKLLRARAAEEQGRAERGLGGRHPRQRYADPPCPEASPPDLPSGAGGRAVSLDKLHHLPRYSPSSFGLSPAPRPHCCLQKRNDFRKMAAFRPQTAADYDGGVPGSRPCRPGPAPFFTRSSEAAYENPYRGPGLHERRRVKHESLDEFQGPAYQGPAYQGPACQGPAYQGPTTVCQAGRPPPPARPVKSFSLNADEHESRFGRPKRAGAESSVFGAGVTWGGGRKAAASDEDSEPTADDISDMFRFLDEMSVCDSLGVMTSSCYDSAASPGSASSGESLPERGAARRQPDGDLKASVGELAARMSHIESTLASLADVRGDISQVLSKLNKLDRKIRPPLPPPPHDAACSGTADGGGRREDTPKLSPAQRSHVAAAAAASSPHVFAKRSPRPQKASRSFSDDPADAGVAAPGAEDDASRDWRTLSSRGDEDIRGALEAEHGYDFSLTPHPPKSAASHVKDRHPRPPGATGSPLYSNLRLTAHAWNVEQYKAEPAEGAIKHLQAECVSANKLAFWLEDVHTPGYDSLLKRREAEFRRAKVCKMAALIAATFSVILVIVVPICTMKT